MKRKTKILFQNTIGRQFRRELSELDRHPQERRIHGEIQDPNAPKREPRDNRMLVNRAEGLWRVPLKRTKRIGKTAKDKRTGAWAARLTNQANRAASR